MSSTSQIIAVSALWVGLLACTDSAARLDEFSERVVDSGLGSEPDGELFDIPNINGTFFLSLASTVDPDRPFLFLADVTLDGNIVAVSLTGLHSDTRIPVADPPLTAADVPADSTAQFEPVFQGDIPGDTNPFSNTELTVDITMTLRARSEDLFCGDASGMVVAPFELDVDGSTVGAIRVEDGVVGDALPPALLACPP